MRAPEGGAVAALIGRSHFGHNRAPDGEDASFNSVVAERVPKSEGDYRRSPIFTHRSLPAGFAG
jgi:hypothetical protein